MTSACVLFCFLQAFGHTIIMTYNLLFRPSHLKQMSHSGFSFTPAQVHEAKHAKTHHVTHLIWLVLTVSRHYEPNHQKLDI